MVGTVDLLATREPAAGDAAGLLGYLRQLVGEPFLSAVESYGGELRLHFGAARPGRGPRPRPQGSYVLELRASEWVLKPGAVPAVVFPADAEAGSAVAARDPAAGLGLAPAVKVTAADLTRGPGGGYGLSLSFADGSALTVSPSAEPDPDDVPGPPVADWRLLTPHGRDLRVGPGPTWAYLPADGS